jgi:hypothetical protein
MIDILSNDPAECAASLDDNSLGKMISACAQVLCNVHYKIEMENQEYALKMMPISIPEFSDRYNFISDRIKQDLPIEINTSYEKEWINWVRTCLPNYNALLAYARACCDEWIFRFNEQATYLHGSIEAQQERVVIMQGLTVEKHKYHDVIEWCSENKPDLPRLEVVRPGEDINGNLFPIVMPEKYIVYSKCDKKSHFDCASYDNHQPDIIESYRNYYRSKFRKRCPKCNGLGNDCHVDVVRKYTRREKPEWLGDLQAMHDKTIDNN